MNEQIEKLAEQADIFEYKRYTDPEPHSLVNNDGKVKKFAELLIEKVCYDIMNVHGASPEHIALVAKHYGVEL